MRESFIFHAEYIDDLPEEFKSVFAMYAINYGIYGEEPTLTGLEVALWAKIKRRIDYDIECWESTDRCEQPNEITLFKYCHKELHKKEGQ